MKTYNLLISHSWKYTDAYEKISNMLKSRAYFDFKNYSVPKTNPILGAKTDKALYEAIENKMRSCSAVIILAGVYSSYSKWIKAEIEIANKLSKPIIAIEPFGSEKTSAIVKKNAAVIVKWNTESIVKAIRSTCS